MKRLLLFGGIGVVVIAAVAIYFVVSRLDSLVEAAIERYGTEIAGVPVHVGSVSIALRDGRGTIRGPRDLASRLVADLGHQQREELRVVLLDTRNGVLAMPTVYRGNVSAALVRIAELFRDAVRLHASRLILVHNHPSGDPTPSPDDLHMTAEAVAAGRLLDIAVLDHLVVGHGTWSSLRDRGVAFDRP